MASLIGLYNSYMCYQALLPLITPLMVCLCRFACDCSYFTGIYILLDGSSATEMDSRLCKTMDLNLQPAAHGIIKYLYSACRIPSVWDLCKYSVEVSVCRIIDKQDISWVLSKAHLSQMFICLHGILRMSHTFILLAGSSYGFIQHRFINMLFSH